MKPLRIAAGTVLIGSAGYLGFLYATESRTLFLIGAVVVFMAGVVTAAGTKGIEALNRFFDAGKKK